MPLDAGGPPESDGRVEDVAMAIRLAHEGLLQMRAACTLPQFAIDATENHTG